MATSASGVRESFLYIRGVALNETSPMNEPLQRLPIGANTGFQYEGAFRCPYDENPSPCLVDVWLKGSHRDWNAETDRRPVSVPNDGEWHFVLDDALGGAGGPTNQFDLWLGTYGRAIDIDSQWVSSDY